MRKISVQIIPNAKTSEIVGKVGNFWKIRISAPAHDGKANTELIHLLASSLGVSKSEISIRKGHGAKTKIIGIPDHVSMDDIE
ncbi:MAG: DUF167 domain-containing protein [bacterium]|nr:DUF167 domain-containing protein [bacterium]